MNSVTLTIAWMLLPDGLVWDLHKTATRIYSRWDEKANHPVSNTFEVRGKKATLVQVDSNAVVNRGASHNSINGESWGEWAKTVKETIRFDTFQQPGLSLEPDLSEWSESSSEQSGEEPR